MGTLSWYNAGKGWGRLGNVGESGLRLREVAACWAGDRIDRGKTWGVRAGEGWGKTRLGLRKN